MGNIYQGGRPALSGKMTGGDTLLYQWNLGGGPQGSVKITYTL